MVGVAWLGYAQVPMDAMEYAGAAGLSVLYISGSNLVVAPSIPDTEQDLLFEIYGYIYGVLGGACNASAAPLACASASALVVRGGSRHPKTEDPKERSNLRIQSVQ